VDGLRGQPCDIHRQVFRWTAPIVESPGEVAITLIVSPPVEGCNEVKELKLWVLPYVAALSVAETPSVATAGVGDTITYTFNVLNAGNVTLSSLALSSSLIGTIIPIKTSLAPGESTTATTSYMVHRHESPPHTWMDEKRAYFPNLYNI